MDQLGPAVFVGALLLPFVGVAIAYRKPLIRLFKEKG
jgi:hypothetical protein